MPLPKLAEQQIGQLASWVAAYIGEQRAAFRDRARPIASQEAERLRPFFPADILESVRVVRGRASEPAFYAQLRAIGIKNAPAFSRMAGVTFQDVVVHVEALTRSLLFHELVHAVQYKHLGLEGFADRYVRGFLSGGSYEEIPLEQQAYALEGRFESNAGTPFSVEEDVKRLLRLKQL